MVPFVLETHSTSRPSKSVSFFHSPGNALYSPPSWSRSRRGDGQTWTDPVDGRDEETDPKEVGSGDLNKISRGLSSGSRRSSPSAAPLGVQGRRGGRPPGSQRSPYLGPKGNSNGRVVFCVKPEKRDRVDSKDPGGGDRDVEIESQSEPSLRLVRVPERPATYNRRFRWHPCDTHS